MDEEYYSVKRTAYACVCVATGVHGTATIYNTSEEAWKDARERADEYIQDESHRFDVQTDYDGYKIIDKATREIVICYKVFDTQEFE